MQLQDAVVTLGSALRLGSIEATVYVHLVMSGPAKAGDLAIALKLHRNEVYRATNRLLARGLAQMTIERPTLFAAVAPEDAFESELTARLAAIDDFQAARNIVFPLIQALQLEAHPAALRNHYKLIQGRHEICAAFNRLIDDTTTRLDWVSTFAPTIPLAQTFGNLEAIQRKARAGIHARLILRPDSAPANDEALTHERVETREIGGLGLLRYAIRDNTELLMWVAHDETESRQARDEVAVHTTAPGFVQTQALFFEQTWARAKPALTNRPQDA